MNLTGDKIRGPRGLYGEDRDAKWLERLRSGWASGQSKTQIATGLDCSRNTVVRWVKRLGLPDRPEATKYEARSDEWASSVRTMWMAGASVRKIATKMGCHKGNILRAVKRYDLPARPSPILRGVTPKPREADRHKPGYVRPGRVAPSFSRFIQKAPAVPPRAAALAPTLSGLYNEPSPVRVGVPKLQCKHVIAGDPDPRLCGFSRYTPPKHDEPSEFCSYHFHFRGWP